jgi:endonuclease-3 related protein
LIIKKRLRDIYDKTYSHFGPQHWWPGETPFEVIIGVILTQNTSWINVEKAIRNLKKDNLLDYKRMNKISEERLAELIKPAGYYNLKARRIKNFLNFLLFSCGGDLKKIMRKDKNKLRQDLLSVNGIGPESADSILLYVATTPRSPP